MWGKQTIFSCLRKGSAPGLGHISWFSELLFPTLSPGLWVIHKVLIAFELTHVAASCVADGLLILDSFLWRNSALPRIDKAWIKEKERCPALPYLPEQQQITILCTSRVPFIWGSQNMTCLTTRHRDTIDKEYRHVTPSISEMQSVLDGMQQLL